MSFTTFNPEFDAIPHMPPDYNPYKNQTGIAKMLEDQRINAQKMSESRRIDNMGREIKEIRYIIDELDRRITLDVVKPGGIDWGSTSPEPSVEVNDYTPGWFSRLINNIKKDPMWGIFKIV